MNKKTKQKEPSKVSKPTNDPEIETPKIPEYPELSPDENPQVAPDENPQSPQPEEVPQVPKEN